MKKVFNAIGIIGLVIISFVYTEKTVMVVREYDEIMIKIKEQNNIPALDSKIDKDTIIPGILEKKININESYRKMKQNGIYNEKLLVYEKIDNKGSLKNNYDKYIISGNKTKNMVSLIFVLDGNTDIEEIKKIIDNNEIKVTFAINNVWLEKNGDLLLSLTQKNHNFIIRDKNKHLNSVIKDVLKQKNYCFVSDKNKEFLKNCSKEKMNTILVNTIDNNYLYETKKILDSGSLISYKVSNNLIDNLDIIIKYIKNKGFTITNIVEHLEE